MSFTFEDMKERIKHGINYGNALECFDVRDFVLNTPRYNTIDDNGNMHPISYDFSEYSGKINDYDPIKSYTVWSTEGIWNNPETTKELIEYYASIGFTAMRLPVNLWWHYDSSINAVDPRWLNYIRSVVNMIIDAGMFCLIDVHCENYPSLFGDSSSDYEDLDNSIVFKRMLNRWVGLAETLKDIPEDKLAFELLNEFNFGRGYDSVYSYMDDCKRLSCVYDALITAIRETGEHNTDRLIGIDGYRGDNGITANNIDAFLDILSDKRNFVCATGYLLSEFTFCYNQSFGKKTFLEEPTKDYDIERINNDMKGLRMLSEDGINTIVIEYGTHAYNNFTGTSDEIALYREGCRKLTLLESLWIDKFGVPAFAWDNGFVIDRENLSIKSPDIYNAIFRNADQDEIDSLYAIMKNY